MFSSVQATASPRQVKLNKQVARFEIAKDAMPELTASPKPPAPSTQNTDSGYHGMTEDEMEVDIPTEESSQKTQEDVIQEIPRDQKPGLVSPSEDPRTTDGSFHSAKEEQTARMAVALMNPPPSKHSSPVVSPVVAQGEVAAKEPEIEVTSKKTFLDIEREFDDIGSPSDGSTPDKPLVRKSSLTFASLPAREPLNTKKSMGNRTSQIEKGVVGRMTGNAPLTQPDQMEVDDVQDIDYEMEDRPVSREESDAETRATRLHNKSSTQRLHEKIDMLGKTQATRHSKSIPNLAALTAKHTQSTAETLQHVPAPTKPSLASATTDDDDDWIKPLNTTPDAQRPGLTKSHTMDMMEQIPERDTVGDLDFHIPAPEQWYQRSPSDEPGRSSPPKFGHIKSASTITLVSPGKAATERMGHAKNISVSNPQQGSTTPYGSPKRMMDGPLSASKSKLQSIMKTAKGLFSSSAGISAAAKMEALSPTVVRTVAKEMPGLYPNISTALENKPLPLPPSPTKETRRTRSSTERKREEERIERERQKVDDQLEKAREKERQKAAEFKTAQDKANIGKPSQPQPTRKSPRRVAEESTTVQPTGPKTNEVKRPVKPTKENLQKSKPPTVAIRVGTMSQRVIPSSTTAAAPESSTSKPTMTKKPSTTSLNTTASNSNFKTSVSSQPSKPKALILAAQKKEQVCQILCCGDCLT